MEETNRIQQLLINNNFPNRLVESEIKKFIDSKFYKTVSPNESRRSNTSLANKDPKENSLQEHPHKTSEKSVTNNNAIKLFFRNQMSNTYKQTEKEMQTIIHQNVKPTENNKKLKLFIYYKNKKLKHLFIRNNSNKPTASFNVVYKYHCDEVHRNNVQGADYIGFTRTTLKDRMKQHASIKKHYKEEHERNITGSEMLQNVSVLSKSNNRIDLIIMEALYIKQEHPIINIQTDDFNRTLKKF
jgi:hypothetical protein